MRSVAAERRRGAGDPAGEEVVLGEPQLAVAKLLGQARDRRQALGRQRAAEHEADRNAIAAHRSRSSSS